MIRDALSQITREFRTARDEPFKLHALARFIRREATDAISDVTRGQNWKIRGSAGQSQWATIPWISIFDPVVTDSATRGYYLVYLFSADMQRIYLSLNQGVTAVREEFGRGAIQEMRRRAGLIRSRLSEYVESFPETEIDLGAKGDLPSAYEAAHAFGRTYLSENIPCEEILVSDLQDLLGLYAKLTARGGLDTFEDSSSAKPTGQVDSIIERRRYRLHRKIDRNSRAAEAAKKVHGYECQACGFDFEAAYGVLGRGYIEAHHLTPIAELPEDHPVSQDPETDFAVLCANCHRMIHRATPLLSLKTLRKIRQKN